jgi:hypothetical protein
VPRNTGVPCITSGSQVIASCIGPLSPNGEQKLAFHLLDDRRFLVNVQTCMNFAFGGDHATVSSQELLKQWHLISLPEFLALICAYQDCIIRQITTPRYHPPASTLETMSLQSGASASFATGISFRVARCPQGLPKTVLGGRCERMPFARRVLATDVYRRASSTILNGVSAALRIRVNPPSAITDLSRASPACAPRANPTSCDFEAGVHRKVDAE